MRSKGRREIAWDAKEPANLLIANKTDEVGGSGVFRELSSQHRAVPRKQNRGTQPVAVAIVYEVFIHLKVSSQFEKVPVI